MFALHCMARGDDPGRVWSNWSGPLKALFYSWLQRRTSDIWNVKRMWHTTVALNMEGTTWQGMRAALGAACDPSLISARKYELQSWNLNELNSVNSLNRLGIRLFLDFLDGNSAQPQNLDFRLVIPWAEKPAEPYPTEPHANKWMRFEVTILMVISHTVRESEYTTSSDQLSLTNPSLVWPPESREHASYTTILPTVVHAGLHTMNSTQQMKADD